MLDSLFGGLSLFGNAYNMADSWINRSPDWTAKGLDGSTIYSESGLTKYFKDYDKAISDYFMNKQMDYNTMMSNTAYQRAVADMQAAGLNPAAMAGVQASAASSPVAKPSNFNGAQSLNYHNSSDSNFASMYNSAVNAVLAKDKDAAKILVSEVIDNSKHAHRLEELREKHQMQHEERQSRIDRNLGLGDYYYERAREVNERRWRNK